VTTVLLVASQHGRSADGPEAAVGGQSGLSAPSDLWQTSEHLLKAAARGKRINEIVKSLKKF
jgi:hypothetical protein